MLVTDNFSVWDYTKRFQDWADIRIRAGWRVQSHTSHGTFRVLDERGRVVFTGEAEPCLAWFAASAPQWENDRVVLMLHSLAGSPTLLNTLESRLNAAGYQTANVGYPNLFKGMDDHLRQVAALVEAMAKDGIRHVSFIGHSYGGLLIRALWAVPLPVSRGPVVFFGTPNGGSSLARMLRHIPGYKAFFGPASADVLAGAVTTLPVPDTPVLVVAGGLGRYGFNPLLKGDNDGIVTVAETRLPLLAHEFRYLPGGFHRYLPESKRGMTAALAHLAAMGPRSST